MPAIRAALTTRQVRADQILLDPNNPRLAGIVRTGFVEEERIGEPDVQEMLFQEILRSDLRNEIRATRDSILQLGFLPVDRIVVRNYARNENQRFVVVEGNERMTAIRWILKDHTAGELTLDASRLQELNNLEVVVATGNREEIEEAQWIIQGVRHIQGIHQWGPYQKAWAIVSLLRKGLSTNRVAESLSMKMRTLNALRRSFLALENFKNDQEFSEFWEPGMFSFFEELMKQPYLRDTWLRWSEESPTTGRFVEEANLRQLYSWITPSGENDVKKIPMAIHLRYLPEILQDAEARAAFMGRPEVTAEQANGIIQARRAASGTFDWRGELRRLSDVLTNRIPLGTFNEEDIDLLRQIANLATEKAGQAERLSERV